MNLLLNNYLAILNGIGRWPGDYLPAQTTISKQVSNVTQPESAGASAPQDYYHSGEITQVHLSQASPDPAAPAFPVITDSQALTWQAWIDFIGFTGAAALSTLLSYHVLFVRRLINCKAISGIERL